MSYQLELASSPYGEYATGDNPGGYPYSGVGVYTVPVGTAVFFKIIPLDPDYAFVNWILETDYGNDGTWDASRDYGSLLDNFFLSDTANIGFRLTPVFAYVGTYTLTVLLSTGGTTSPAPGSYQYNPDDVVPLTATPDTGYAFSHWLVDGIDVGSENPTTITMDANYTVQAVFVSSATYTVIMAPSPYGAYNAAYGLTEGTYQISAGESVVFEIIPNAGFTFSKWVLETDYDEDGVWDAIRDLSTNNPDSFISGTADIAFRITPIILGTTPLTLTISLPMGLGTTNPPAGGYTYYEGETVSVSATPDTGYLLSNWLLDGIDVGSANPIQVTMDADHTLQAVFTIIPIHTLSVNSSPEGIGFDRRP